jgi:hypothetical protein
MSEIIASTDVSEVIQPDLGLQVENETTPNEAQVKPEKTEESEQKKPIDEKLSSKFAALSRKEKQLKQQEAQFKQRDTEYQATLSQMKSELEKVKAEFEQYRTGIKRNPLKHLEQEGYDFDKLTQMQLNDQNPTPEMMLERTKQELESGYKSEIEKMSKEELKIMRNEIYAQHGYIFKSPEMTSYFAKQPRYNRQYEDVTSMITHIEKKNIELIKYFE